MQTLKPFKDLISGKFGYKEVVTDTIVVQPIYELASNFLNTDENNYAIVRLEGKEFHINILGASFYRYRFDKIGFFFHGYAPVMFKSGFSGFVDRFGKLYDKRYNLIDCENCNSFNMSYIYNTCCKFKTEE